MFRRRTRRGPFTGLFQTPVCTVRPRHGTSFGSPTLTDNSVAMALHPTRPPGGGWTTMQPLLFVSHPASVAFAVAVGCFAVMQLVTGAVTDVRKRRSRTPYSRLDRGSLQLVVACCAVGVLLGLWCAYHLPG